MYEINDYIIYGNYGICKVIDVGVPDITGIDKNKQYYILSPVNSQRSIIYSPVDNTKVNMRKIISYDEAKELISRMPSIPVYENAKDKLIHEKYKNAIVSQECEELIKVIKTAYKKQRRKIDEGKKLGQVDERYMRQAEDILYGELSIVLNIPVDEVKTYCENKLSR